MARYGKQSQEKVRKSMHEYKRGRLTSGRSGKKVKRREQAIAIGLSQARRSGLPAPRLPVRVRTQTGPTRQASAKVPKKRSKKQ
ncbi:MAG: DUF6496 domain-containing protein [bacterium]|nr:DUF6496 domain-containing protein [bacterium]